VRSTSAIAVLSINFSRALVLGRVYRPVRADRGARAINVGRADGACGSSDRILGPWPAA
jgi:hypothetical protein